MEKNIDKINKAMKDVIDKSKNGHINYNFATKLNEEDFQLFSKFIYDKFGIHLEKSKQHMLELKLCRLVDKNNLKSFREYYNLITNYKNEDMMIEFLNEITINKTDFFRENNHFIFLKNKLDYILQKNKRIKMNNEIRVWSSASSTGEEPYTLAMVLKEILPDTMNIKILATDISHKVLKTAMQGVYPSTITNQIEPYYIQKYFHKKNNSYEVNDVIKEMITFRSFNLKERFPFKNSFDIIFCRNVMIYFDSIFQEKLINEFYQVTSNGGLLFIGHSESLSYIKHKYKYVEPTVYIKE